jgi:hypothetical protein
LSGNNKAYFCSRKLLNHDLSVWLFSARRKRRIIPKMGDIEVAEVGSILSAQRLAG